MLSTTLSISSNGVWSEEILWQRVIYSSIIILRLAASALFAFSSSLRGFGFSFVGVFSPGISIVNFFPSDFLVNESLPALSAFGIVLGSILSSFAAAAKEKKLVFLYHHSTKRELQEELVFPLVLIFEF